MSEYDNTMLKLAGMASKIIAHRQKISRLKAFMKFMKSETADMLFDSTYDLWMNGPDYIADEYKREMYYKRYKKPMC